MRGAVHDPMPNDKNLDIVQRRLAVVHTLGHRYGWGGASVSGSVQSD